MDDNKNHYFLKAFLIVILLALVIVFPIKIFNNTDNDNVALIAFSAIICVCIICLTVIACLLISALKSNKTQSSDSGTAMKEAYKEIFGKCKDKNVILKDATKSQTATDTKIPSHSDDAST